MRAFCYLRELAQLARASRHCMSGRSSRFGGIFSTSFKGLQQCGPFVFIVSKGISSAALLVLLPFFGTDQRQSLPFFANPSQVLRKFAKKPKRSLREV